VSAFNEDPTLGVLTTINVINGAPILLVSHDLDDGGWQFLCGTTNDADAGRIVHLAEILATDPTLKELGDLPLGWIAFREFIGGPWKREPV
jgi:hypothetical protein